MKQENYSHHLKEEQNGFNQTKPHNTQDQKVKTKAKLQALPIPEILWVKDGEWGKQSDFLHLHSQYSAQEWTQGQWQRKRIEKKPTKDSNSTWAPLKDLNKETHLIRKRKGYPWNIQQCRTNLFYLYIYFNEIKVAWKRGILSHDVLSNSNSNKLN